ncbi:hypothetical protein [Legionella fallonii]|uniref:Coiled-coil protein n=1 Tax=Legionella fallonii LLAP-10 TaxID=1212491 RepID=A0A098G8Z7_9GAMM|nr:hypothetical protein [Legionella fallonii]CEG58948.1 conserved membrane protein of unknown function [Legionella fallonii LLAP-10]
MATSSLILQSYFKTVSNGKKDKQSYNKKVKEFLKTNRGADFLTPLNHYISILEDTEQAMLPFMTAEKKKQVLRDLQVALLLLMTQKRHELQHQKTENVTTYNAHIKNCCQLIDAIQYEEERKARKMKLAPDHGYATDGYPVQYLGLSWGQWFAGMMVDWADRKTKTIKEVMGAVNEKRLYWVWGSSLLKTTLDLMPADIFNVEQAKQAIRTPDPYTGYMSWILYYFRFALNLSLLLKHTISGPWMSKEEKKTPWTERFLTQWDQRKFTLLNDSLWATANMVCFFWLTGKGVLGTWGDLLTLVLLVFDISMAVWDFEEQKTRHNKEMLDYETNIKKLKEQINKPKEDTQSQEDYDRMLIEYKIQLLALEKAQTQCKKDWDYQKISLINNITYAAGLMLAFALLTTPFLPIAGPAALALVVTGAVLCFALTVIYNAVRGGIEIYKAKQSASEVQEDCANKIALFLKNDPPLDDNEKRLLFLEIKKLKAETSYQEQMVVLQTMHLIRSILFEALLPAVIFASFVFLPIGAGFGILGAVLALTLASHFIINAAFKPEKEKLGEFNEQEFEVFCKDPEHWDPKAAKSQTFFSSSTKQPEAQLPQAEKIEEQNEEDLSISFLFDESDEYKSQPQ